MRTCASPPSARRPWALPAGATAVAGRRIGFGMDEAIADIRDGGQVGEINGIDLIDVIGGQRP